MSPIYMSFFCFTSYKEVKKCLLGAQTKLNLNFSSRLNIFRFLGPLGVPTSFLFAK